ncbi:MAG: radical SAM protein [Nitrososphaerota archaeon]
MGCAHGCVYCYARAYTRYREVADSWGKIIYIKENALEVLRREVYEKTRGVVGVSTITDPYQYIEAETKLTRKGIEILLESRRFKISIQTKSPTVLRDLDLFLKFKNNVDVGLTITTVRDDVAEIIEPNAPPPSSRIDALKKLSEEGLETWIFLGPIMRDVNDSLENIEKIVELAQETGSQLYYDFFRIKKNISRSMKDVKKIYPKCMSVNKEWRGKISHLVESLCEREGVTCKPAFPKEGYDSKII